MDLNEQPKFKYEQICYWYTNALYEVSVLNTPKQHWKACLDCGSSPLEVIIGKDCFVDVKDMATPNIQGNYEQIQGTIYEGSINKRFGADK